MDDKVKLTIELPDKVLKQEEAYGVIIPAKGGDITILSQRAPSVFVTDFGAVRLIDEAGKERKKYFVSAGMADVAAGVLHLLASKVEEAEGLSLQEVIHRKEAALADDEKMFYQMVEDQLQNKRGHYKY